MSCLGPCLPHCNKKYLQIIMYYKRKYEKYKEKYLDLKKQFENKIHYLIITVGPTGSGKSNLINKTTSMLKINNYVKILIDDLIENDQTYKEKIIEIIKTVKENCENENINCTENCDSEIKKCIEKRYSNPDIKLIADFNETYYASRKGESCMNIKDVSCDELNDFKIKNTVSNKKNIVLEITGEIMPNWLFDYKFIPENYQVILSYSLVNFDNLIARNESRLYDNIKKFEENYYSPTPRLPEIRKDEFLNKCKIIKDNLIKLYECNNTEPLNNKCFKYDQLLLFNNNTNMELVFDSSIHTSKTFNDMINTHFIV